jgi:uncharacterized damage-inducible protein DinB
VTTTPFPEPASTSDLRGLLLDYLDFFRGVVSDKLEGLNDEGLRTSVVPTGWTPAALANHLVNVERRWLHWGFLGEPIENPWRDSAPGGGWVVPDTTSAELAALLDETASRTRSIVEAHALTDTAAVGGRFLDQASAPQLQWILLHLIQEYARHTGHLDIARELIDGRTGPLRGKKTRNK